MKLANNLTLEELNSLESQIQKRKAKFAKPIKEAEEKILESKLKPIIELIKEIQEQEINVKLTFKLASKEDIVHCLCDGCADFIDIKSNSKILSKILYEFQDDARYVVEECIPELDKKLTRIDRELSKLGESRWDAIFQKVAKKMLKEHTK